MPRYTPEQIAEYRREIEDRRARSRPAPPTVAPQNDELPSWFKFRNVSSHSHKLGESGDEFVARKAEEHANLLDRYKPIPGQRGWYWDTVKVEAYNAQKNGLDFRFIYPGSGPVRFIGHDD